MSAPEPWGIDIDVVLRDLDALRHVNNAVYATYLETARNIYVAELEGRKLSLEFHFILARQEIDFRSAAGLGDRLRVSLWPTRLGTKSFDFAYHIRNRDTGALVLEALSVQVAYDYDRQEPRELPADLRQALERELARGRPAQPGPHSWR